ncbi:hypothetical protein FHG87_013292 [Trinorchestia longiramus]|nr:hypothetical protein FHG87_013292 [Trinorchestia longiramus]
MKGLSRVSSHILKPKTRFLPSRNATTQDALEDFDPQLLRRRSEAQRSIVVQVPSVSCAEQVFKQCSAVGQVSSFFHYTTFNKNIHKYQEQLLVEFLDPCCVQEMMHQVPTSSSTHLPYRSPFFLYSGSRRSLTQTSNRLPPARADGSQQLITPTSDSPLSDDQLKQNLYSCSNISEQMQLYYDQKKLSDLGYRLRFFTCRQIEVLLSGLLPHMSVLPFGSSVNGSGHSTSDLDMVMQLEALEKKTSSPLKWTEDLQLQSTEVDTQGQQRVGSVRFLELVADLLNSGTPGTCKVVKILKARVPIVKYEQQLTGLKCDLSVNNWSGLYMSELLYLYNALDCRVGPLLFALRLWAREAELTTNHPGRWITNFSVTTLALFYLVSLKILPTFDLLTKHARAQDTRVDEKGMTCTYLRSLSTITALHQQPQAVRTMSLEDLLYGFFCFYDQFNFNKHGLTITTGKVFNKPYASAMYIQNPLDGTLNVSRNVTLEEVERFSIAVTRARYTLKEDPPQSNPSWGILGLLSTSGLKSKRITRINLEEIVGSGTPSSTASASTAFPSTTSPSTTSSSTASSSTGTSSTGGTRQTAVTGRSEELQKAKSPPVQMEVPRSTSQSKTPPQPAAAKRFYGSPHNEGSSNNSNHKNTPVMWVPTPHQHTCQVGAHSLSTPHPTSAGILLRQETSCITEPCVTVSPLLNYCPQSWG